jgi:hypothetical protein
MIDVTGIINVIEANSMPWNLAGIALLASSIFNIVNLFCTGGFLNGKKTPTAVVLSIAMIVGASYGIIFGFLGADSDLVLEFCAIAFVGQSMYNFTMWYKGQYISRYFYRHCHTRFSKPRNKTKIFDNAIAK